MPYPALPGRVIQVWNPILPTTGRSELLAQALIVPGVLLVPLSLSQPWSHWAHQLHKLHKFQHPHHRQPYPS